MKAQFLGDKTNSEGNFKLLSVTNVSITQFSMQRFASEANPEFMMEYNFLGHHTFKTTVPIFHWYNEFKYFFDVFLKSLFL